MRLRPTVLKRIGLLNHLGGIHCPSHKLRSLAFRLMRLEGRGALQRHARLNSNRYMAGVVVAHPVSVSHCAVFGSILLCIKRHTGDNRNRRSDLPFDLGYLIAPVQCPGCRRSIQSRYRGRPINSRAASSSVCDQYYRRSGRLFQGQERAESFTHLEEMTNENRLPLPPA